MTSRNSTSRTALLGEPASVRPAPGRTAPRRTAFRSSRAFTLLEMVVVITIIAVLAGSLLPVLTRPYVTERRLETVNEMGQIEQGILGHPEYGDYGFLGTMGALPGIAQGTSTSGGAPQHASGCTVGTSAASAIVPLITNGATSSCGGATVVKLNPTASSGGPPPVGVPTGWNGPYIRSEFQDPTMDAWGTQYVIAVNPNDETQFAIESAGPDHTFATADDIIFPSQFTAGASQQQTYWFDSAGSLLVDVYDNYGSWQAPVPNTVGGDIASVEVWHADGANAGAVVPEPCTAVLVSGQPTSQWNCGDQTAGGHWIPFGLRTIQVTFNTTAGLCTQPPPNAVSGKYSAYYAGGCVYTQNVVMERRSNYAKVQIPIPAFTLPLSTSVTPPLPGVPNIVALGASTLAAPLPIPVNGISETTAAGFFAFAPQPAPFNATAGLAPTGYPYAPGLGAPGTEKPQWLTIAQPTSQYTIADTLVTGSVVMPAVGITCALTITYNSSANGGTNWTGWGTYNQYTINSNNGSAVAGTVVFSSVVPGVVGAIVPFTNEMALPVPPNNTVAFDMIVAGGASGTPCVVRQAQMSVRQWYASP